MCSSDLAHFGKNFVLDITIIAIADDHPITAFAKVTGENQRLSMPPTKDQFAVTFLELLGTDYFQSKGASDQANPIQCQKDANSFFDPNLKRIAQASQPLCFAISITL